jgi:hypothetical protein
MRNAVLPHNANVLEYTQFAGAENDPYFYGVELELELKNDKKANAKTLKDVVREAKVLVGKDGIVKWDGSLALGIEIVSRPMTFDFHKAANWDEKLGAISKNFDAASTCGLHIHVSRAPITDSALNRILTFIYARENDEFVQAIAGRGENRYAARLAAQNRIGRDRYQAVNILNPATIEFRMFAGTTNANRLWESLEFVDALVKFASARSRRLSDMNVKGFVAWLSKQRANYPNFWQLVKALPQMIDRADSKLSRTVRMRHRQNPNSTAHGRQTVRRDVHGSRIREDLSRYARPSIPPYLGRDSEGNPTPTLPSDLVGSNYVGINGLRAEFRTVVPTPIVEPDCIDYPDYYDDGIRDF